MINPSLPSRDVVQYVNRQPDLATMPSDVLVRAVHPVMRLPSPARSPAPLLRAALRLRSWLLTALPASTLYEGAATGADPAPLNAHLAL